MAKVMPFGYLTAPDHIRLKCSNDSNIFFAVSAQNPHIFAR
ncbi:hypothetical protein [Thiothrix eikelboomii]